MNVAILCEFSGTVRDAFIRRGHNAVSCDLLPCRSTLSGAVHIQGDVLKQDWRGFDLLICHPPCTFLCSASNAWMKHESWRLGRESAIDFVKKLMDLPVDHIAIENPIGILSSRIRKPDQVFRAFQFGHPYKKDTCLWLKNLPPLIPTGDAPKPYKTFDFWSGERKIKGHGGCRKSVTFLGVAVAMAEQWGGIVRAEKGEGEQ